jgi:hypothetical protein
MLFRTVKRCLDVLSRLLRTDLPNRLAGDGSDECATAAFNNITDSPVAATEMARLVTPLCTPCPPPTRDDRSAPGRRIDAG